MARKTDRRGAAGWFVASLLWPLLLSAQPVEAPPQARDPAITALLQPWDALWPRLGEAQRDILRDNARHWSGLDGPAREALAMRLREWDGLQPVERATLRQRLQVWHGQAPDARATVADVHAKFQALDPQQQAQRRAAFLALAPQQRAAFLHGDAAELAEVARQAFAFVPGGEREATLAMLRALPEVGRVHTPTDLLPELGGVRADVRADLQHRFVHLLVQLPRPIGLQHVTRPARERTIVR